MQAHITTRTRVTAIPALIAAGTLATVPGFLTKAVAGQATPATGTDVPSAWLNLDLPELNLTVTAAEIEDMPEALEAGRYLLHVSGEGGADDFALGAIFLQLPEGLSLENALAQAGEASQGYPAFFYESVLTGSKAALVAMGETSATSIIDLTPGPGQWVVLDPTFTRDPVPFSVTGDMPADVSEPESTSTVVMGEMYFELTEGSLVSGENLVKVVNEGAQPHFVEVMAVPDGTTNENIAATIEMEMGATPAAEPLDFEQTMPVAYFAEQSTGVTFWAPLTLEPGTYAVLCWVTDPETGMPHAMMGMHDVYTVE